MTVPPLPQIDSALVADHQRAHEMLAAVHNDAPADVVQLFRMQQRRLVVESLAYVQPAIARPQQQLLIVPPRSFLTAAQQRRMTGAKAAFRHIDSRVAMLHQGHIEQVVNATTPVVLHALVESSAPTIEKETNPGMFRSMATSWLPEINGFAHPPATMVEELVEAALHMANHADAPACARAAWLTFTMLAIHPFVDGNGRTSRALYMAVLAPSLPLGIDWAALEQWSVWRDDYIYALQAGQDMEHYDPTKMTAAPFITFATRASIAGADLCKDRLEFIATYVEARVRDGVPRPHAIVLTTVSMWGIATLAELAECALPAADIDEIVGQLLTGGKLRWMPRPHSRRTFERPEPFGLIVV